MKEQTVKQVTLLLEFLDDFITEDNPVRVIDVFVEELHLGELGFAGLQAAVRERPGYSPAMLLKLYIYGGSQSNPVQMLTKEAPDYRVG